MASTSRRKSTALDAAVKEEAWRFDFFQAVRLLEHMARNSDRQNITTTRPLYQIGNSNPPDNEIVRFRALAARSFPAGNVSGIKPKSNLHNYNEDDKEDGDKLYPFEMEVAFMGLTGPAGVLPEHYLDLVLQRVRENDFALRDFLDLFNHRSISFFHRAWEKYRFPINYERARLDGNEADLFTRCLESFIGMGTQGLKRRLPVDDTALTYFAGHFAHFPRSAVALEAMLVDVFKVSVHIEQFCGRWLELGPDEQTQMPTHAHPNGRFNQLGIDAMIGSRVWDVQGTFRIQLGPLTYRQFSNLLPSTTKMDQLISLTRSYVGPDLDIEVQLVLAADEVPPCQLSKTESYVPQLGWNTWMYASKPASDRDDALFTIRDLGVPRTH